MICNVFGKKSRCAATTFFVESVGGIEIVVHAQKRNLKALQASIYDAHQTPISFRGSFNMSFSLNCRVFTTVRASAQNCVAFSELVLYNIIKGDLLDSSAYKIRSRGADKELKTSL